MERVSGFLLPGQFLILALKTRTQPHSIAFTTDISPSLSSGSGRYVITACDQSGRARATRVEGAASWSETTRVLAPNELALFEIAPEE